MANFVIAGDTSGTVTLQAPAVSGTTTLTLPTTSGTVLTSASTITPSAGTVNQAALATGVAGTGPAFSAYTSANQTGISNSTWTKVTLNAKEFDTNNNFDSTTNYRFTPTVAGYYEINATISFNATVTNPTFCRVGIYKNGSLYKAAYIAGSTLDRIITGTSTLIYFNGSTDYVELYGFVLGSNGGLFDGGTPYPVYTHMSGSLIRGA